MGESERELQSQVSGQRSLKKVTAGAGVNPSTGEAEASELRASLVYIARARISRIT